MMKTLLFSPPKYNGSFITVNDCCWGTGEVQVLQDRLLRIGSFLLTQGDEVAFLDAGMCGYSWVDVFRDLKKIKPDRLIFQVVPQFESWQMIVAEMCSRLEIEPIPMGITEDHEEHLTEPYETYADHGSYSLGLPSWDKMPPIDFNLFGGYDPTYKMTPVIQISDGCPYACVFCPWSKKDFKMLPVDTVFANLRDYKEDAPMYLLTAQITTNKTWLERFCERKKEFNLNFEWTTDINAREIDEDKIELLKASNCTKVVMGIESTNQNILDLINKKITVEDILEAVVLCKKHNLGLTCSFLYNIDPSEDVDKDILLYKAHKSFAPSPGIVKAYVGTKMYDELPEEHELIMSMGTNPIPVNPYLKSAIKKLKKWESVLK